MNKDRYESPIRINGKFRQKHIVIWERMHNKKLPKGWDIHHIDGNGKNNSIDNLLALPHNEHMSLHDRLRKEGKDPVDPSDPYVISARERCKRSRIKNKEKIAAHKREYYKTHPEQIAAQHERSKIFRKNNPELTKARYLLYRAKKTGKSESIISELQNKINELMKTRIFS